MVVEQQGVVADRPNEHLGVSDGGIILVREMMREALAAVAAGQDPPAIIRDPAQQLVDFPQKSVMMLQRQQNVSYALR
jgi:5,5'-dehydrodivanillate O-demethylase